MADPMTNLTEQVHHGLNISKSKRTKFVLNVPMYVPEDNAADISSDESEDAEFNTLPDFDVGTLPTYPYRSFKFKTNGEVPQRAVGSISNTGDFYPHQCQGSVENSLPQMFLSLLKKSGFDDTANGCINDLGVIIGLNRPKSLSKRRNNCLIKQLNAKEDEIISSDRYKKFAFYWNIPWTDSNGIPVEYSKVQKFYKQLKKKNPDKAEKFIKKNEDEWKPFPPYQFIREKIKNHAFNKEIIQKLKGQSENPIIYVSFVDGDTKNFNGIYSAYVQIVQESTDNCPKVMSTGYEFSNDGGFPLYVGSKLERIIRIVTAKAFGPGVYYPEPNFCVLLAEAQEDLSNYSFVDTRQVYCRFESPILLRVLLGTSVPVFSDKNPLITSSDRAQASSSRLVFSDRFTEGGAPNTDDQKLLSRIMQSTLNHKQWAEGLYYNRAFTLSGSSAKGRFVGLMAELFKGENEKTTLQKLQEIVKPKETVQKLHNAAKGVRHIVDRFFNFLDESKERDYNFYDCRTDEFYELPVLSMLAIIDLFDKKEAECYRALNGCLSLCHLLEIYNKDSMAIEFIFSEAAENIVRNGVCCFKDVTYEELEDLYFGVIKHRGNSDDYDDLINSEPLMDESKEEYSELELDEVKEVFFNFIDDNTADTSAYERTIDYFYEQFHKDDSDSGAEDDSDSGAEDDSDSGAEDDSDSGAEDDSDSGAEDREYGEDKQQ